MIAPGRDAVPDRRAVTKALEMPGLVLALAVLPATGLPQQPPTFSADVDLVRIDVVVLDRDGQPVTGLTAADFEIRENKRSVAIESFEPVVVHPPGAAAAGEPAPTTRVSEPISAVIDENRYFLVYFDDVHVQAENTERVRSHLTRFLERETRAGDWVSIMAPLAGLRFTARTPFEREKFPGVVRTLKGQLVRQRLPGEPSDWAAMRQEEYGSPAVVAARTQRNRFSTFEPSPTLMAAETYAIAKRRIRRSLTGIADAVVSLSSFRGRKSLILYSEGFIRSPSLPDYDRVVELSRRSHVAIYAVDPRGLTLATGPAELDTAAGGSSYVALATGGRVSTSNDLAVPLRAAALESSAYYLLGFEPPSDIPGEHRFEVRVGREGVTVRTTDRYILGGVAREEKAPALEAIAHVSDASEIPVRVSTLFLGRPRKGRVETTLAVEVDRAEPEIRRLDLLIEARPGGPGLAIRDSAELTLPRGDGPVVATRELDLAPGLWQARVVVRDVETDRLGSVLHTFEVPAGEGLRVSTPILGAEVEKAGAPEPRLRVDRRYPPDGMLYCLYHVFGATREGATRIPRVRAGYVITRGDQVVLAAAPSLIEPTRDGELLRLIGFGLSGWEPGDYVLTLGIFDDVGGEEREVREPFRVVAHHR